MKKYGLATPMTIRPVVARTKLTRFTTKPLPADVYAELAVLRAVAEATSYQIVCAGIMALAQLSPQAVQAIVSAYAPGRQK